MTTGDILFTYCCELFARNPLTGSEVTLSNGSGFLIREDGLILTNAHVVANKRVVTVHLFDGTIVDGVIQAVDPISDLATLKINKVCCMRHNAYCVCFVCAQFCFR